MLTEAEKERKRHLEERLGVKNNTAPNKNHQVLTKPTEESFLRKALRTVSQLPRGLAQGAAGLADIPYAAGHLALKQRLPSESLGYPVEEPPKVFVLS